MATHIVYRSTRPGSPTLSFEAAVLAGLAPNSGLYLPQSIPTLPVDWQSSWSNLSFVQLAFNILSLFIPHHEIDHAHLLNLIQSSYSSFDHPLVAPLHQFDQRLYLLELWHGPTLAFKDIALQFLGNLFEFFLTRHNILNPASPKSLTVVGATSGDTGSAAIYGLRQKKNISIFILHPRGRVSPIQEAQMTSVADPNVFNIAVQGTFDDCQDLVKSLFNDSQFNAKHNLAAVNSINWARILAQIVYYFSAYLTLKPTLDARNQKLQFVVPTGNFGDILAGFYAQRLGLPIGIQDQSSPSPGLVIATNSNDILTRFWETGRYGKMDSSARDAKEGEHPGAGLSNGQHPDGQKSLVKATLSPAMDILVSSNFERLLSHLVIDSLTEPEQSESAKIESSQSQVNQWMSELKTKGFFQLDHQSSVLNLFRTWFGAGRCNDLETSETIKKYYYDRHDGQQGYLVDPHTAVGLHVAEKFRKTNSDEIVQVVLSTAHPAKFVESIGKSLYHHQGNHRMKDQLKSLLDEITPPKLKGILDLPKRSIQVDRPDLNLIKKIIEEKCG